MDNLTHSLVGYALARTGIGRTAPAPVLTLVLASNAPDIDIVTAISGGGVGYLDAHRGATHGPLGCLFLGALVAVGVTAGVVWRARTRGERLEQPLRALLRAWSLAMIGIVVHIFMDLPTSYGTRLLSPFIGTWYAFDWMPIIDVYLWAVLAAGAAWMHFRPASAGRMAVVLLTLTALDYAGRGLLHQAALADAASRTADGRPSPCAAQPTLVRHPTVIEAALAGPESCIQAAALPTFLSPLTWRAIRHYPGGYELSQRTLGREDTVPSLWIPSEAGPLIARARATPTARVFLDFSRFPAARVVQTDPDAVVVRMVDVRFLGNPLRWDENVRARAPFVVTVALDRGGRVLEERLGP